MKSFIVPALWLIIGCIAGALISIGVCALFQDRKPEQQISLKQSQSVEIQKDSKDPKDSDLSTKDQSPPSSAPILPKNTKNMIEPAVPSPHEKTADQKTDQVEIGIKKRAIENVESAPPLIVQEVNEKFLSIRSRIITLLESYQKEDYTKSDPEDYRSLLDQGRKAARTIEESADILHQDQAFRDAVARITTIRKQKYQTQLDDLHRRFNEIRSRRTSPPERILKDLAPLVRESNDLAAIQVSELQSEREKIRDTILHFNQYIQKNEKILSELVLCDSMKSTKEIQKWMKEFVIKYPDSLWGSDFRSVLSDWDHFSRLEIWNQFVEENGKYLDRFAPDPKYASAAIHFLREKEGKPDFLPEWKILEKRSALFLKDAQRKEICKPIRDLFENASSRDLWIYHPTPDDWYYLTEDPRAGTNYYIADLFNKIETIEIPGTMIASIQPAVQTKFFKDLSRDVQAIPDKLKYEDPGKWYSVWCVVVEKLRKNEDLDPLVRFMFLKDVCTILSEGDSFFHRRLATWLRVLNTSPFNSHLDWFDAKNPKTSVWRKNANQLLAFLKSDDLSSIKSTDELNASVPSCGRIYRRIGWLDRDPDGNWYVRGNTQACPDGDLMVLRKELKGDQYDLLRIGSLENGLRILAIASSELKRGMQVVCVYKLR